MLVLVCVSSTKTPEFSSSASSLWRKSIFGTYRLHVFVVHEYACIMTSRTGGVKGRNVEFRNVQTVGQTGLHKFRCPHSETQLFLVLHSASAKCCAQLFYRSDHKIKNAIECAVVQKVVFCRISHRMASLNSRK